MSRQKTIIVGVILIAILLMAIGYAGVTSTNLTITGTASATAAQDNFKVYFTGANTVKNPNTDAVSVTATNGQTTATVNVSGLTKKEDTAYAILEIENGSNAVNAESVNVITAGTDNAIFDIEAVMCNAEGTTISDYSVDSGAKTYVKVSATLKQTPTSDTSTSIAVTLTASPEATVTAQQ